MCVALYPAHLLARTHSLRSLSCDGESGMVCLTNRYPIPVSHSWNQAGEEEDGLFTVFAGKHSE